MVHHRAIPIRFSKFRWAGSGRRGEGWSDRRTIGYAERREGGEVAEEGKKVGGIDGGIVGIVNTGGAREGG